MVRLFLASLFVVISFIFSWAQRPQHLDSLLKQLHFVHEDSTRSLLFASLTDAYCDFKLDSAYYFGREGLQLARNIDYPRGVAWNTFWLAVYFRYKGSPERAARLAIEAEPIFEKLHDYHGLFMCTQMKGWAAQDHNDYVHAHDFTRIAARIAERYHVEDLRMAYSTLAEIFVKQRMLDSAMFYAQRADSMFKGAIWPMRLLAEIHYELQDFDLSRQYYLKTISENDRKTSPSFSNIHVRLAETFMKIGQTDSALYYAKKGLRIATDRKYLKEIEGASEVLATIYKGIHNGDSTLKYMEMSMVAKDSLFSQGKTTQLQSLFFNEKFQQQEMDAAKSEYSARIRSYILYAALIFILVVALILYRNGISKQRVNTRLQAQKETIESTLSELRMTQGQLIQKEKMASLGALTAGIAHEIQNPLNFVNNFSEVNKELIEELKAKAFLGNRDEVIGIATSIGENENKIVYHGKRADAIVKNMLQHSRSGGGTREPTDLNILADEYLRLAYHGHRVKDNSFSVITETDFDTSLGKINVIPQDIGRVILNLITNAFYAVAEKRRNLPEYEPMVMLTTRRNGDIAAITIADNGIGIPKHLVDKIFQPFFTTKPAGQGTGLGLSLSYDILKAHGGAINVKTKEGEGTEFVINLPAV